MGLWIAIGVVAVLALGVGIFFVWRRSRDKSEGPVSIVLFRRTPATITESDVRSAIRRSLGIDGQILAIPIPGRPGMGFACVSEQLPTFAVIIAGEPYFPTEDIEPTAAQFEDPRARAAMREHTAWLSVDAMGMDEIPEPDVRRQIYDRVLGRVAAQFADDQTMMFYFPAERRAGPADDASVRLLAQGNASHVFNDPEFNAPIINVSRDDQAINHAMQEANRRLPELVMAFDRRGDACEALFKARFTSSEGDVEYMWLKLTAVESAHLTGEVVNNPSHPEFPVIGSIARIHTDQVVDWAYIDEHEQPHGMFVERLLRAG